MYEARLKTGEDVVIKVQKPGVAEVLKTDLGFMYITSKLVEVNGQFVSWVPELFQAAKITRQATAVVLLSVCVYQTMHVVT